MLKHMTVNECENVCHRLAEAARDEEHAKHKAVTAELQAKRTAHDQLHTDWLEQAQPFAGATNTQASSSPEPKISCQPTDWQKLPAVQGSHVGSSKFENMQVVLNSSSDSSAAKSLSLSAAAEVDSAMLGRRQSSDFSHSRDRGGNEAVQDVPAGLAKQQTSSNANSPAETTWTESSAL